jgi:hypothetical protein
VVLVKRLSRQKSGWPLVVDRLNVYWGVETFTITSKIDNRTGAIVDATMENILTLRMRVHATSDLKTYTVEMPFLIKRSMHLELLK